MGKAEKAMGKAWENHGKIVFFCWMMIVNTYGREPFVEFRTTSRKTMEKARKKHEFSWDYNALIGISLREDLLETVFGDSLGDVSEVPFNQVGDPLDSSITIETFTDGTGRDGGMLAVGGIDVRNRI